MQQDGYYYVNSLCVTVGAVLLFTYIAPTIRYLECKFFMSSIIIFFFSLSLSRAFGDEIALHVFIDTDNVDFLIFCLHLASN
jgi:hypothetical protein